MRISISIQGRCRGVHTVDSGDRGPLLEHRVSSNERHDGKSKGEGLEEHRQER